MVRQFVAGIVVGIALVASVAYAQESTGGTLTGRDFRITRACKDFLDEWLDGGLRYDSLE